MANYPGCCPDVNEQHVTILAGCNTPALSPSRSYELWVMGGGLGSYGCTGLPMLLLCWPGNLSRLRCDILCRGEYRSASRLWLGAHVRILSYAVTGTYRSSFVSRNCGARGSSPQIGMICKAVCRQPARVLRHRQPQVCARVERASARCARRATRARGGRRGARDAPSRRLILLSSRALARLMASTCPGRKPPFLADKRPTRPYRSATENRYI